jgi:hypothetical protein
VAICPPLPLTARRRSACWDAQTERVVLEMVVNTCDCFELYFQN